MTFEKRLSIGLLIARLGVASVFLVWTIDRLTNYAHNSGMMEHYYFIKFPPAALLVMGLIELIFVLGFLFGIKKFWTYGFILSAHAATTLVTFKRLIPPYDTHELLYFGALPMLGACVFLFLLREDDNLLNFGKKPSQPKRRPVR